MTEPQTEPTPWPRIAPPAPPDGPQAPETASSAPGQRGCNVTHQCAAPGCSKRVPVSTAGRAARFCSSACRVRAHRRRLKTGTRQLPDDQALSRDEAIMRLGYAIRTADGLRAGLEALVRIMVDERPALLALPASVRRAMASRFLGALGLAPPGLRGGGGGNAD